MAGHFNIWDISNAPYLHNGKMCSKGFTAFSQRDSFTVCSLSDSTVLFRHLGKKICNRNRLLSCNIGQILASCLWIPYPNSSFHSMTYCILSSSSPSHLVSIAQASPHQSHRTPDLPFSPTETRKPLLLTQALSLKDVPPSPPTVLSLSHTPTFTHPHSYTERSSWPSSCTNILNAC